MGVRGRVLAAVAALAVAASSVAGCTSPPEVGDGELGVDWAVLPTPSVPAPPLGCTQAEGTHVAAWTLDFLPGTAVDCVRPHLSETYYIGTLPAELDTDPNTVPTPGGARFRFAYTDCLTQATAFLGASPQASRLQIRPVMPSDRQWAGQARWFRCELLEVAGLDRVAVQRSGSLKGALDAAGDGGHGSPLGSLATTCADVTLNDTRREVLSFTFTPCEREHDVELTGAATLAEGDGSYPGSRLGSLTYTGCVNAGAQYVGVSNGALLKPGSQTYTFASDLTEEQWSAGVRAVWCFYGSTAARHTGSVKGLRAYPYA